VPACPPNKLFARTPVFKPSGVACCVCQLQDRNTTTLQTCVIFHDPCSRRSPKKYERSDSICGRFADAHHSIHLVSNLTDRSGHMPFYLCGPSEETSAQKRPFLDLLLVLSCKRRTCCLVRGAEGVWRRGAAGPLDARYLHNSFVVRSLLTPHAS
jgi:hypothetical protein